MALSTVSCGRALNWKAVTVRSLVKAVWWVGHGVGTPDRPLWYAGRVA